MAKPLPVIVEDVFVTVVILVAMALLSVAVMRAGAAWRARHTLPEAPRPSACVGRTCPVEVDLEALYKGLDEVLDVQHLLIHELGLIR